jgi:hypothetical protein
VRREIDESSLGPAEAIRQESHMASMVPAQVMRRRRDRTGGYDARQQGVLLESLGG